MIIRVFRPTIHAGKEREFDAFLRDTALPLVSQPAPQPRRTLHRSDQPVISPDTPRAVISPQPRWLVPVAAGLVPGAADTR
jgi:hypothetical protein